MNTKNKTKMNTKSDAMAKAPAYIKTGDVHVPETESVMSFPIIKLLQQLSPELDKDDVKYLKKASEGDILITNGTQHHIISGDEGLQIVPMMVRKQWTEWVPRKKGGGFVAAYTSKEEAEAKFTVGNELVISIDYLVVSEELSDNGVLIPMLLQFNTPTKMSVARELQKYITQYKTINGVNYILKSKKQSNKAGQKFYNYFIEPAGWTNQKLYAKVEALTSEKEELFLPMLEGEPAF